MISWQNKMIRVQARLVPRFLWTTASIDVFWGDQCILCTGGQFKAVGSHSVSFRNDNSEHHAVLSWGRGRRHRFPYQLQIDGVTIDDSQVNIENWGMAYIPAFLVTGLLALLFFVL
jgi:hypothetical protein